MATRIGIVRAGERSARELAAASRSALDRALRCPAELWVATCADDALLLGAFGRAAAVGMPAGLPLLRRGSGGPEVRVAPGTVHVALALATPAALVPCDEKRIVNRAVRPLLRALAKTGNLAHYFGRDWVSAGHRPVAWVGFGHDAASRRTLFEAFVAVRTPFAAEGRASFLGKAPAATGGDPARLADAIAEAYAHAAAAAATATADADAVALDPPGPAPADVDVAPDPPWAATREEAIGTLGAGPDARGVFRVGGDLLVSRDALARLEARAPATAPGELSRLVDETLAAPGVALDGVRSLASVRDVVAWALGSAPHG